MYVCIQTVRLPWKKNTWQLEYSDLWNGIKLSFIGNFVNLLAAKQLVFFRVHMYMFMYNFL